MTPYHESKENTLDRRDSCVCVCDGPSLILCTVTQFTYSGRHEYLFFCLRFFRCRGHTIENTQISVTFED